MLKRIKNNFIDFLDNKAYIRALLLVIIFTFGYAIISSGSVNIDTLSYDRYFTGNELLAQGRFGGPLLESIFHIYSFCPFFMDTLCVLLLCIASILICSLFKEISKNKLPNISYIIFSSLFVSYPLLPEIFTYTPAGTNIALCYILTTISFILSYNYILKKDKLKLLLSSLPLLLAISLYESFAPVYLLLIFMTFILDEQNKEHKFKDIFLRGVMLLVPLVVAIILNTVISKIIIAILNLTPSTNAAKAITYLSYPLIDAIKNLIVTMVKSYIVNASIYFPITILLIAIGVSFVLALNSYTLNKNKNYLILYLGLIISTFSLSLVQGVAACYRTCQTFAPFVAFIFMLLQYDAKKMNFNKYINYIIITLIGFIIFKQCYTMNYYLYINNLRYEEEKNVMINVAQDIEEIYDGTKKVIIKGSYTLSDNIIEKTTISEDSFICKLYMKNFNRSCDTVIIGETKTNSYINWGIRAFGEQATELNKWWEMLGYDFEMATLEEANSIQILGTAHYPNKGYIIELENYIIVYF